MKSPVVGRSTLGFDRVTRRDFARRALLGAGAAGTLLIPGRADAGKERLRRILAKRGASYWAENRPPAGTARSLPSRLFPADNWWNVNCSAAPLDANSAAYMADLTTVSLTQSFGDNYGYPFSTVSPNHPKIIWDHVRYASESDVSPPGGGYPVPIPAWTQRGWTEILGGGGSISPALNEPLVEGEDRHLFIVDPATNYLYEMYEPYLNATGGPVTGGGVTVQDGENYCTSCSFWDMNTNNVRTAGWTSADAAGLQVLPGCVQYDECAGAVPITHAHGVCLNFGQDPTPGPTYVWPATHAASSYSSTHPPFGARFRMKASYNITGFGAGAQRLAQAFKDYGLLFIDNSSNGDMIGTNDDRWGDYQQGIRLEIYNMFATLRLGLDFELVELGWGAP